MNAVRKQWGLVTTLGRERVLLPWYKREEKKMNLDFDDVQFLKYFIEYFDNIKKKFQCYWFDVHFVLVCTLLIWCYYLTSGLHSPVNHCFSQITTSKHKFNDHLGSPLNYRNIKKYNLSKAKKSESYNLSKKIIL